MKFKFLFLLIAISIFAVVGAFLYRPATSDSLEGQAYFKLTGEGYPESENWPIKHLSLSFRSGLEDNKIYAIDSSLIGKLTHLESVKLYNIKCNDLSSLTKLQMLKSVLIWDCEIENLSELQNCTQLENFFFASCHQNLGALPSLPQIKSLSLLESQSWAWELESDTLDSFPGWDISGIEKFPSLQSIWLDTKRVQNFRNFRTLTSLENIFLQNCLIHDFASLKEISSLRMLILSGMHLTQDHIAELGELDQLSQLVLDESLFVRHSDTLQQTLPNCNVISIDSFNLEPLFGLGD